MTRRVRNLIYWVFPRLRREVPVLGVDARGLRAYIYPSREAGRAELRAWLAGQSRATRGA